MFLTKLEMSTVFGQELVVQMKNQKKRKFQSVKVICKIIRLFVFQYSEFYAKI